MGGSVSWRHPIGAATERARSRYNDRLSPVRLGIEMEASQDDRFSGEDAPGHALYPRKRGDVALQVAIATRAAWKVSATQARTASSIFFARVSRQAVSSTW